jgi:hypothetical protein
LDLYIPDNYSYLETREYTAKSMGRDLQKMALPQWDDEGRIQKVNIHTGREYQLLIVVPTKRQWNAQAVVEGPGGS